VWCRSPFPRGHFHPCPHRKSSRVCSELLGWRVHLLLVFTFPAPASPSLPLLCYRAAKTILRLTLAALPASTPLGREVALCRPCLSLCSFLSRTGMLQRNRKIQVMLVPPCPGPRSALCADRSGFCTPLPPGCALAPFPSPFLLRSAGLPWRGFSSWRGSGPLILHFLVPLVSLSRSLLKTLAGKKAGGSSLAPGFLFAVWFLSRVWQSKFGEDLS